ncbi:unnamed protein product [Sphagnum balticum]
MMEMQESDGSSKRAVPCSGSNPFPNKRRLVTPAGSEKVYARRHSEGAQQQGIVPSVYGTGDLRAELSCLTQERETLMKRIGVLIQERQALEVLLANSEMEKKTWSEICSNTLTSMKGLEAEIECEKQKMEQSGHEAEKQLSEMQSLLLQLTDEKQKILVEKDSEHEALSAKVVELEECKRKLALENKSLNQTVEELKDKTANLEAEYGNVIAEKLSITAALEDYKSKGEKLQIHCENLQANHEIALDKCDRELLELICERDYCEEALIKAESMMEQLEKEHKSLQRDYETLNSLKVKEQAGFQLAYEVYEKTAKKMELQLEMSRAELSKLKTELHTAIKQEDAGWSVFVTELEKLIAAVSSIEEAKDSAVKELEHKLHLETMVLKEELAMATAKNHPWLFHNF